jgi:hypothetical protein
MLSILFFDHQLTLMLPDAQLATRYDFVIVLVLVSVLGTPSYIACIFSLFENEDDDEDNGFNPATRKLATRTSQRVTRNPQPAS